MADLIPLTESQLGQILSAVRVGSQGGWWPVASVFVSSLLGVLTGIGLEQYKNYRITKLAAIDRQKQEITKINVAIVSLGYNLETLHAIASQYFIPFYEQSHAFYEEIQKTPHAGAATLSRPYPALSTTCPEILFIEQDFLRDLPFVVEKDADLVKDFGWVASQGREIAAAIRTHNEIIALASQATVQLNGLPDAHLYSIAHRQTSLSESECLLALQLLGLILKRSRSSRQ